MGTKNNPGKYDCYSRAEPDEPIFTLRGSDPFAPQLVRLWAFMRRVLIGVDIDDEKGLEAKDVADAMERWRLNHPL